LDWVELLVGIAVLWGMSRLFKKAKKVDPSSDKPAAPKSMGELFGRLQDWSANAGQGQQSENEPQNSPNMITPPAGPESPPAWHFNQPPDEGVRPTPPYEDGSGKGAWLLWVAPILILLSITYYYYQPEVDSLINELMRSMDW
jgi:hypothetical protein